MKTIKRMYDHLHWANQKILEALKTMEAVDNHNARRLFSHILCAERVWLSRIQGRDSSQYPIWAELEIEEVEILVKRNENGFSELLSALTEVDLDQVIIYKNSKKEEFQTPLIDILTHVALHGQHHRGQINLQLRAAGFETVPIDFITFARKG
ncbi:DinB family protein [Metabacillus schmidteae]|uniref:DinB family protein n=1 Tax=Metabacillus schmidteae TaxID=2730405 RepID=UPI00158AD470|nr:DinB family protein [Metabacillus schmidteae]